MKKWMYVCTAGIFLFLGCKDDKTTTTTGKETDKMESTSPTVTLPYQADYSSSFEMGDPAHTAMILQGSWKDWELNQLDNMKTWLADTVRAVHSDMDVIDGADSLMATWKRNRAAYSTVIDTVDAAMSVYSTDKKENWVLVWATEINTKNGVTDTVHLMETWRINKDGKADLLLQFDRRRKK